MKKAGIGKYRELAELRRQSSTLDNFGQKATSYTKVRDFRCNVIERGGGLANDEGKIFHHTFEFFVRAGDYRVNDRVIYRSNEYEIELVRHIDNNRRYQQLTAVDVTRSRGL